MHFVWFRACPQSAGARAELLVLQAPPEARLPPGVAGGDRTRVPLRGQAGQLRWAAGLLPPAGIPLVRKERVLAELKVLLGRSSVVPRCRWLQRQVLQPREVF